MEIDMKKTVKVKAKTFRVNIKCSDRFQGTLVDQDGEVLKDYEGYVPSFFPGNHYGDYLLLDIDIDTGQITNWPKIKPEMIEQFIEE